MPFAAVRSFADPSVNFALEFAPPERAEAAPSLVPAPTAVPGPTPISTIGPVAPPAKPAETGAEQPQEKTGAEVVTLDSFRKR